MTKEKDIQFELYHIKRQRRPELKFSVFNELSSFLQRGILFRDEFSLNLEKFTPPLSEAEGYRQ